MIAICLDQNKKPLKQKKPAEFKWGNLSERQRKVLQWWTPESPVRDYEGIICDGSIRSGKTVSMGFSFVTWAMASFNGQSFIMAGKTIGTLRRNVIKTLMKQLRQQKYTVKELRGQENVLTVSKNGITNYFYEFGGNNESSQDTVQGMTAAGAFFDEVALMPESFVDQATGRCSVDGSKWWFNCNPMSPMHWFYQRWILKCKERRLLYLHFTMKDNLTLTERIRKRYESQYSGVFYKRYILGLWCMAEGLIYDMFSAEKHILKKRPELKNEYYISCDYGIQNATVFLLWRQEIHSKRWICEKEYYYSGREESIQKTVNQLADGLESILPRDNKGKIIVPEKVIIDPSAAALIVELRRRGYTVTKGNNDVLDGIEDCQTLFHQDQIGIMDCCKKFVEELGIYAWDQKASDRGEDKPVKDHDHCCDAFRYFVKTMRLVKNQHEDDYVSIFG